MLIGFDGSCVYTRNGSPIPLEELEQHDQYHARARGSALCFLRGRMKTTCLSIVTSRPLVCTDSDVDPDDVDLWLFLCAGVLR